MRKDKEQIKVLAILKTNVDEVERIIQELKEKNRNFKFLDSGDRNKKYYYIVGDLLTYNYDHTKEELSSYGEELDYESIIAAKKYNI